MRKLLIFVNKFDEDDDLLGFFVGWTKELTQYLDSIIVVAQHIGKYEQTSKLKTILIDKSQLANPIKRVFKFISLLFRLKNDYGGVLVIMSPSWAIMASLATKILGKKLYLWYAVWRGNWKLRLAEKAVDKVFCSVPEAFPFKTAKLIPVGQGIDTDFFKPDDTKRKSNKILYLGRISPIKKLEVLLEAIAELKRHDLERYNDIKFEIAGGPSNAGDDEYVVSLKKLAADLDISEKIKWSGRIPHSQTVAIFQEADIVVNLTPTGSFDKAMLEAMSCGDLVLASNQALAGFFNPELKELLIFKQDDPADLATKLRRLLILDSSRKVDLRRQLRDIIINHHSQKQWAKKLVSSF